MRCRYVPAFVFAIVLAAGAYAQDAGSAPQAGQNTGQDGAGGNGQRGGRGFGGMGTMGRGLVGTVTEAGGDHYTIRTEQGDVYTVHFSADTRVMRQPPGMQGQGGNRAGGMSRGGFGGGARPEEIKTTDIKVGDVINAMGQVDATGKTVGATRIMLVDPEMAKRMAEMEANFGKTWLQGRVTAIDGVKITITGTLDNAAHTVVADENTTFRKRREPVTLADIQVGDMVRADGALKDGAFTATSVDVGGMMGGGRPASNGSAPPQ